MTDWIDFIRAGMDWSPEFWIRCVFQFFVHGFFFLMTLIAVHRKPDGMDRILGPGYRRGTGRLGFAAQVLPPSAAPRSSIRNMRAGSSSI